MKSYFLAILFLIIIIPYSLLSEGTALTVTITATEMPPVELYCGDGICNNGETCSTCAADCGACSSGGGGGGGGGGIITPITQATFIGKAYPKRAVTLLKDAQVIASSIAGADANFKMSASNLSAGNYIFSIYSEDKGGRRSSLQTFPVSVTAGAATEVSGIFIAPSIDVGKKEVKRGDNIAIFGQTVPLGDIVIFVHSAKEFFAKTISDKEGTYLYNFDTSALEYGSHIAKSKASTGNQLVSRFSSIVNFKVGTQNIIKEKEKIIILKGEVNNDGKVNLVDFSIAAYWYKRSSPPANVDLNNDGKVSLVDFSIMAYYWTG